jgi:hypothetical protein
MPVALVVVPTNVMAGSGINTTTAVVVMLLVDDADTTGLDVGMVLAGGGAAIVVLLVVVVGGPVGLPILDIDGGETTDGGAEVLGGASGGAPPAEGADKNVVGRNEGPPAEPTVGPMVGPAEVNDVGRGEAVGFKAVAGGGSSCFPIFLSSSSSLSSFSSSASSSSLSFSMSSSSRSLDIIIMPAARYEEE